MGQAEQRSPFAPAPLQDFRHYYGLLRPGAPHRSSRPRGTSRLRLLPSRPPSTRKARRRTGSHVPNKSLIEVRAAYTPDAARSVSGHPPSLSRRKGHPAVLTTSNPLSTLQEQFACARLSRPCLPRLSFPFFFFSPPPPPFFFFLSLSFFSFF